MAISLYPHNQRAYDAACAMLADTGKACIIHPTGTGKSFIAFKYCEDNPDKKILWLSPSEYIFRTQLENLHKATDICQCQTNAPEPVDNCHCEAQRAVAIRSPLPPAADSKSPLEDSLSEGGARRAEGVPPSLRREASPLGNSKKNLVFLTYARLMQMTDADREDLAPDAIVLDEFHRCGAMQWGLGVQKLLKRFPDVPLLGLTATNIRYLDNQRDMASELFDSNIASEITLGEAIALGILPAPKYILSIFKYKDDLAKYELRARRAKSKATRDVAEEILEKLRRALDRAEGMDLLFEKHMEDRNGKYLVFCANAEHMRDMMTYVPEWFSRVDPHPHVYSAYSEDPSTDRSFASFKADDSDHLKLLFCIDMLNEGIHVDDVSGVILLRPTGSPIVYKQQIGRALSARPSPKHCHCEPNAHELTEDCYCEAQRAAAISRVATTKTNAHELPDTCHCEPVTDVTGVAIRSPLPPAGVPLIFDIVLNIENLYSIDSLRSEIADFVQLCRDRGEENKIEVEDFTVIDEVADCRRLFAELDEALTSSWDEMYRRLVLFKNQYGHVNVPAHYQTPDGLSLGNWCSCQRRVYSGKIRGILTADRIRRLNDLGFQWDPAEESWLEKYRCAEDYYCRHRDLLVPGDYVSEDGVKLGMWIGQNRSAFRERRLSEDKIRMLQKIGMVWDVADYRWDQNYALCREYFDRNGCPPPTTWVAPDGSRPGAWLSRVVINHVDGDSRYTPLRDDQIKRLREIGVTFERHSDWTWNRAFSEAEHYYHEHHNLDVPSSYVSSDGLRLRSWLEYQRQSGAGLNHSPMTPERRARLDALHFDWDLKEKKEDTWPRYYESLKKYVSSHDGKTPAQAYVNDDGLRVGRWLTNQRRKYRKGTLDKEQEMLLRGLGVDFGDPNEKLWSDG